MYSIRTDMKNREELLLFFNDAFPALLEELTADS